MWRRRCVQKGRLKHNANNTKWPTLKTVHSITAVCAFLGSTYRAFMLPQVKRKYQPNAINVNASFWRSFTACVVSRTFL